MVNMNIVIVIILFIIVVALLAYNWHITNRVYDLEDELDEIHEKIEGVGECLDEIASICDDNTNFITDLCDSILEQEKKYENDEIL